MKFDLEQLISILKNILFGLSQLWQLWLILGIIAFVKFLIIYIRDFFEKNRLKKS